MKKRKSIILALALTMMTSSMNVATFAAAGDSANNPRTEQQIEMNENNNKLQAEMAKRGREVERKAAAVELGISLEDYDKLMNSDDEAAKERAKEIGTAARYECLNQSRLDSGYSCLSLYIADYTRENESRYASVAFSFLDDHNKARERAIIIVTNNYSKAINELNKKLGIDETYEMLEVPEAEEPQYVREVTVSDEDKNMEVEEVKIDEENFPDESFRNTVKTLFDLNENNVLEKDELLNARIINTDFVDGGENIKDTKGIEKLPFLEDAVFTSSGIEKIDVSKNTRLRRLELGQTNISELDVSKNPNLWYLDFTGTNVSEIDLSHNPKLEQLHGFDSKITEIDVSHNPELLRLDICRTAISNLDVTHNPKLFAFNFEGTNVSSIDLSKNKALYEVYATDSKLESIDVSNNPNLGHIRVSGTKVKSLDLSKNLLLGFIMIGKTDIKTLDISKNHGVTEILAAGSNLENIIFPYKTGIKTLELNNTKLKELNLQGDKYLVGLDISNTGITDVDVTNAAGLSKIYVEGTGIKNLDLSNNHKLRKLNISNTRIEEAKNLDLSHVDGKELREVIAENAGLESLKLPETMESLESVMIAGNNLAIVNLDKVESAWYTKTVSPQNIEIEGAVQDGNIQVDMRSLVDDIAKIEIADTDSYTYKDGIVTFKNRSRVNEFVYTYSTGSKEKELSKMEVHVKVKADIPVRRSSSKKKKNTDANTETVKKQEVVKIENNNSERNDKQEIKNAINSRNSRVSGKNRFETAVEVSKMNYKKSETVIIANSEKPTDILTTAPLAEALKCPVLYTRDGNIPQETMKEIERLGAKRVVIIGGTNSVSENVSKELASKYGVQRLAGKNRFETANMIAENVMDRNSNSKKAIVVSANSYADALTISSLAAKENIPVLITDGKSLSKETEEFIKKNGIKEVVYAGGTSSISENVQKEIEKLGTKTAARFAGKDRYETAAMIAKSVRPDAKFAVCVSGENLSDAIIANSLGANLESSILLVKNNSVPNSIMETVKNIDAANRVVVGGENTVSKDVINLIKK